MSEEIVEIIENVEPGRVFTVESEGVWFSGMNANVSALVEKVAEALEEAGYTVGDPLRDPENSKMGGVFLPVEGCSPVEKHVLDRKVSYPGGTRGEEIAPPEL